MSEERTLHQGISRRSFLKTTAAVVGAAAAGVSGGVALAADNAPSTMETVVQGVCRGTCMGGCLFNWTVRDGHIVKSEVKPYPRGELTRICSKGLSHAQRTYSPNRVKYPMRRVAGSERGSGQFERISWDDAIKEIATKWTGYMKQYGGASICRERSSGIGQAQVGQYLSAMSSLLGFSESTNLSDQAAGYMVRYVVGGGSYYNFGNEPADIANAKNVFLVGSNGAVSQLHCSPFLNTVRENGGHVVVIDPNYGPTAAAWGTDFVPVRVGTDACLYMGMLHVIIDEGLVDEPFLRSTTYAPLLVDNATGKFLRQEHLDGVDPVNPDKQIDTVLVCDEDDTIKPLSEATNPVLNGTFDVDTFNATTVYDLILKRLDEYPLDMCAELCDVPVEEIKRLARIFADGPTTAIFNFGCDKYYNGHLAYFAACMVSAFTGNLYKRGASFMQAGNVSATGLAGSNAWTGAVGSSDALAALKAEYKGKAKTNRYAIQRLAEVVEKGTVNGQPLYDGDLHMKSWYLAGHNSIYGTINRKRAIEAANNFEFIVVQEMFWNTSCNYADIVLPVCYYTEYEEVVTPYGFSVPYVSLSEKAVDPAFESKSDYEIVNLIFKGMGLEDLAIKDMDQWFNLSFDKSSLGMTWGDFKKKGIAEVPTAKAVDGGTVVAPCSATGKRVMLYIENPKTTDRFPETFDVAKERMIHWEPPMEAWPDTIRGFKAADIAKKYPLCFHQKRSRFATHTSFGLGSHWLDELDPEPTICMNPKDCKDRGISNGDIVKVFNDRGHCIIKVVYDEGTRPGSVGCNHRYDEDAFIEGTLADLPNPDMFNPYMYNSCYYDVAVEVELRKEA